MLLLVAAATVSAAQFTPQSGASAQATASVRIVRATPVDLHDNGNHNGWTKDGGPKPRTTVVNTESGPAPARLIEFE